MKAPTLTATAAMIWVTLRAFFGALQNEIIAIRSLGIVLEIKPKKSHLEVLSDGRMFYFFMASIFSQIDHWKIINGRFVNIYLPVIGLVH